MSAVLNLEVPQDVLESARLSAADLKTECRGVVRPAAPIDWQGAGIGGHVPVGISPVLASRRVAPHYGEGDLAEDVKALRELGRL